MKGKINYKLDQSTRRRDERGFLVDFLKADELKDDDKQFGQIYFITFEKPGVIRGNHYHATKKEWHVVVQGKVLVTLEDVNTKTRETLILNGDEDQYTRLFFGEYVAHSFINLTPYASVLSYCNKPWHVENKDDNHYALTAKSMNNGKDKEKNS